MLTARLKNQPGVIWDGEGDNPYFAFLAGGGVPENQIKATRETWLAPTVEERRRRLMPH